MLATTLLFFMCAYYAQANEGLAAIPLTAHGQLLSIEKCEEYKDIKMPVTYENVSIERAESENGHNVYIANGKALVTEPLDGPFTVEVIVYKCEVKMNIETCKLYTKWETDGCKELKEKKGPMYQMMEGAKVKDPSCPLQPGEYIIEGMKVNVPDTAASSAEKICHNWWVKVIGKSGDKVVFCTVLWAEVKPEGPKKKKSTFPG